MLAKFAIFCKNLTDWFKSDRCFLKYFAQAFPLANNLLLLTFVLLAIFIISMYMVIAAQMAINPTLSLVIVILLSSALAAGFFYAIKHTTDKQMKGEKVEKTNIKLAVSTFYTGVGEYYLSFICMFVVFFILAGLVIAGTFFLADKLICSVSALGLDAASIYVILADPNQVGALTQSISPQQQQYLRYWCRLFLFTTQAFTFLIMLWIPEVMYARKNIFTAFFTSIKKIFSDFPRALCVYLTTMFLNYMLALFIVLFSRFSIISFLLNIVSLYLLVYVFYAIFIYYKTMFIENTREWIA